MDTFKKMAGGLLPVLLLLLLGACAPKKPAPTAGTIDPDRAVAKVKAIMSDNATDDGAVALDPEVKAVPKDSSKLSAAETKVLDSHNGLLFDLDMHDTKEVRKYFTFYTHRARKTFTRWLKRSEQYLPYVRKTLTKNGLPQDLALLPFAESGYNAHAYSWAGAGGMWQFMPYTGRKYGLKVDWWIDERRDPYKATVAAVKYLKVLHERFGDWYLALAAYNAGEGKISKALRKTKSDDFFELTKKNHKLAWRYRLRQETKHYVPKFIAISKIYRNLGTLGFDAVCWDQAPEVQAIEVPGGTDLLALARSGNMSWKDFHKMNPAYRRMVAPPGYKSTAYVPVKQIKPMLAYLAKPGSQPYAGYIRHKVRSGQSWWTISRRYRVPITILKKVNNSRSNILRPGQYVMVPGRGLKADVPSASSSTRKYASSRANYTVKKGDTLWSIAKRFKTSVRTLQRSNGLRTTKRLRIGSKIYVPDNTGRATRVAKKKASAAHKSLVRYKVRRGDNLYNIARKFGVSVKQLCLWNGISKRSLLRPGQRLRVYVP